jgi:ribosomal protein S18 acetylase RimI-like enzyme
VIAIRRGCPADAEVLAGFAARTFEEAYGAFNRAEDMAAHLGANYSRSIQAAELTDPATETIIATGDAGFAAFAQVRRSAAPAVVTDPEPVELWRFYVDRPWQGRGLAQRLMEAVHGAAARLGGRSIWLSVWEKNPRAIAFYTKVGFRDVGPGHFLIGADLQDDRIMATPVRLP